MISSFSKLSEIYARFPLRTYPHGSRIALSRWWTELDPLPRKGSHQEKSWEGLTFRSCSTVTNRTKCSRWNWFQGSLAHLFFLALLLKLDPFGLSLSLSFCFLALPISPRFFALLPSRVPLDLVSLLSLSRSASDVATYRHQSAMRFSSRIYTSLVSFFSRFGSYGGLKDEARNLQTHKL